MLEEIRWKLWEGFRADTEQILCVPDSSTWRLAINLSRVSCTNTDFTAEYHRTDPAGSFKKRKTLALGPSLILLHPLVEYLTELREYGTVYSSWAESEEELQRPLEGMAGCVTMCCRALEDQSENMSQDFLPVLREYVLYIESMKVRDSTAAKERHDVVFGFMLLMSNVTAEDKNMLEKKEITVF